MNKLNVTEITSADFEETVLRSPIPVLVDFYGAQCPPCQVFNPRLEELAAQANGTFKLVKVDAYKEPDFTNACKITALPTLLVYKGGKETARLLGLQNNERIIEALEIETE